jgi:hypothetical protein
MSAAKPRRTPARKSSVAKATRTTEPKTDTDAKQFVFEEDASPEKYMPYIEHIDPSLGIEMPGIFKHSIKQDPSGTLTGNLPL